MRQLKNKHLDTTEGASALPGEIVSSQFAPSVSQKDEKMNLKYYAVLTRTEGDQEIEKLIGAESKEVVLKTFPKVYKLPVLAIKKCTKKDIGTFRGGVR